MDFFVRCRRTYVLNNIAKFNLSSPVLPRISSTNNKFANCYSKSGFIIVHNTTHTPVIYQKIGLTEQFQMFACGRGLLFVCLYFDFLFFSNDTYQGPLSFGKNSITKLGDFLILLQKSFKLGDP